MESPKTRVISLLAILIAVYLYRVNLMNTDTELQYEKAVNFILRTMDKKTNFSLWHF
jgi:hypothetical protein